MSTKAASAALLVVAAALSFPIHASSGAEKMLAELRKTYPKTEFSAVHETDVPDVFEVWMGRNVAYVSGRNPRYFVLGRLFDTQTLKDVTGTSGDKGQTRTGNAPTVDVRALPFHDAIKTVRGTGARTLVVFSDPACPYCKQLEAEISKLKDITIYTFLLGFQGVDAPAAIWCAPDRQQVWERYMTSGDRSLLAASTGCDHPLDRNAALAHRLDVVGTPALFFADGSRINGFAQAPELETRLNEAGSKTSGRPAQTSKEEM